MNRAPDPARSTRISARLAAAFAATTVALGAGPAWAEFRLNIVHLNDPHSRIEPINRFDSTCSSEDDAAGECFGGFARLKTAIEQRREALEGPTIVVSAGDHFQGSLFYTTYKGAGEAEMAEAIGVDLLTLGNHEFDDGDEELGAFLDGVSFPVLGANVDASRSEAVDGRIDPYVIAEFDDGEGGTERVAFVGVVASDTAETSSPGPNIDIGDDLEALREAVAEIEAEGVNKIIAVTHVGLARDRELAAAVPAIDIIIGGHSHTLLSNEPDDVADGVDPYPVVVNGDTPIVQVYAYGKYLGESVLRFDDEGNLASLAGDPILVDASFAKDEALEARIQEMLGPIERLKQMVVGGTTDAIDGDRSSCRAGECEMGNLVADAMLDRVADQGVDVAIQNGGGLRASIDAGTITMGEVLTVLPFQNTLATFELTGADIVASLEQGVSEIEEGAGRFPQVAGMSYAFDPTAEVGSRVSDVRVGGEPIDPDATYGVATNNFMRGGGDGYELFETEGRNAYDFGPGLEQVVADYIAAEGPITPALDGRIVDLSADGGAADADEETSAEAVDDSVTAELEAAEVTGEAVAAINEAVDDASGIDALAAPPEIAAPVAEAEQDPVEVEVADTANENASGEGIAKAVIAATPEPTVDNEAVEEAVAEVVDGEAVSAINEAVEAATDLAPLAEAPIIETADETDADGASEATDAVVAATPEPTAATDEVQEAAVAAAEDAASATESASAAINESVEAATDLAPLADAPTIEAPDDEGVVEAIVEVAPAPTANGEAVKDAVESAEGGADGDAAEAVVAATPEPTAEVEAVQDAVEETVTATADEGDVVEEIVEATPEPEADTEAVAEALDAVEGETAGAVAAINGAVDAATEEDTLAAAPEIEVPVEAPVETVENAVEAPTSDTEAVQDAVAAAANADTTSEAGDAAVAEGGDAAAAASVNGTSESSANADVAVNDAVSDDAATDETASAVATDDNTTTPDAASADDAAVEVASVDPTTTEETAGTAEPRVYTIQSGDTFWSIAGEIYGDPRLFTLLVEANEEGARRLQIGDEIVVPDRPE